MQWPEPAYTEQSLARSARPTKGGAVRIRIALGTAAAVIALPAMFFAVFTSSSGASARVTRHEAASPQQGTKIGFKLMSYAQAEYVGDMATYANAVEKGQEEAYLIQLGEEKIYFTDLAYLKAVAAQRQQAAAAAAAASAAAAARAAAAQTPAVQTQASTAATPVAPAPSAGSDATSTDTADWACIRQHESGDDYDAGNGGAYQFEYGTWSALTGLPSPAEDYPPAVQDAAALKLYSQRGWEPWTTRYVCGL
jgi:Transglycosylase-like domain